MEQYPNLINKSSKEVIYILAAQWNSFTQEKKQEIAIGFAGRFNLSKYMVLMDNLAEEN